MVDHLTRKLRVDPDDVIAGDGEIVVELMQRELSALAIEVTLLLSGMAQILSILAGGTRLDLQISTERTALTNFRRESDRVACVLSRDSAEYLQATLLRAYRDGMAEVNHVHIEGTLDGRSYDLTFVFELSRPPMTPEEASKRMGS